MYRPNTTLKYSHPQGQDSGRPFSSGGSFECPELARQWVCNLLADLLVPGHFAKCTD